MFRIKQKIPNLYIIFGLTPNREETYNFDHTREEHATHYTTLC